MQVQIKKDESSGESYLDIEDFKDIVDIKKVEYYSLDFTDHGDLIVTFFNKKKKVVKPKKQKVK